MFVVLLFQWLPIVLFCKDTSDLLINYVFSGQGKKRRKSPHLLTPGIDLLIVIIIYNQGRNVIHNDCSSIS